MTRTSGYALHQSEQQRLAVAVARTGERSWRLEDHVAAGRNQPWPAALARDLARAGDRVAWILPEDEVTSTQTTMPRLKRAELKRAVTGWVARQEGGRPDDWVVSWSTHPTASGNEQAQQVAMVYARREVVTAQAALTSELAAGPGTMLPPSLILDQFFRRAEPSCADLGVWNLVFVGGQTNILCVASKEGLLLTRPLPGDLAEGVERSEYLERLATEVDRSVFFARQTAGSPQVDGVFVCGDRELATDLVARLAASSEVPARAWLLDDFVDCGDRTLPSDVQLLLMAAALATDKVDFNLAPRAAGSWLNPRLRRRVLLGAGAAGAALVPILLLGGLITGKVQDQYLAGARERLAVATDRAAEAAVIYDRQRLLRAREDFLASYQATRHDLAGVLLRLAAATPPEVLYRDLQVSDRDGALYLHLTGESVAPSVTEAQQAFMVFHAALTDSEELRPLGEPRQLQIAEINEEGRVRKTVLFSLDCELTVALAGEEG